MNATSVAIAIIALAGWPSHAPPHVPSQVRLPASEPPHSGLSGVQLLGDDFTSYRTRADLLAAISANLGGTGDWKRALYHDGRGAELVSLDESVRYNGHRTIKYRFPVGGGPPELWPQLPRPLDHMWFRVKIRFERGFNTLGTIPASNAYKLLGWNLTGGDGSGRIEITNTSQYELYWNIARNNVSYLVAEQFGYPGNITTEWTNEEWWDYIIEWKKTSDSTVDVACWIQPDGVTRPRAAKTTSRMLPGKPVPQVNAVMLGMNRNQNILREMSLNYGQWEVVDGAQHPNPFDLADPL